MEKRRSYRFDKVFPVGISSAQFGECQGIARNISEAGMFVEMSDPLPLGSPLEVHFRMPDSPGEIIARAEVKGHYFMNYSEPDGPRSLIGMGLRFTGFDESVAGLISATLERGRTLH